MGADPRFFERLGPLTASSLAALAGARLEGDGEAQVCDVAELAGAASGALVFIDKAPAEPLDAHGACVIAPENAVSLIGSASAVLVHAAPRAAFARALQALLRVREHEGSEPVAASAQIDPSARLAPGVVIGPDARIGADVVIGPGAVIGPGVDIGPGCRIGARAVILCTIMGRDCEIAAGAIIGESGFGLAYEGREVLSLLHAGRVMMGDAVTVGANTTIDRGMLRDTVIGTGCRIDNLCQIAHNVELGEYTIMAALAGLSGSVKTGPGVMLGGRVGLADHVTVGAGARLAASSGVMHDIPAGETWGGTPAQPMRGWMRETAWLRRESARKPGRSKPEGSS
ncbi:UDP-3-O-(3-hydroxymyristoyl)glucosamine N-acyltransferase [Alkalicaulis satelles]|uniref:UDP-3-O-(3-hydroxymyristoyl)glucosamine N-acyltransferase n=1 Tax=Alkalicaulis satelles TaxID=2609175 RepID=A0A5M6ZHA8_9PROT|nr:UDP-3-O-(3-hydroxymyristoyl)glucosamine N-acyltransferase [Alkalicaulis satelles]KAA5801591.1 UDP-3-O-(3-hydroxymyristoyl)glucosamine N-acyltransferase [Alkalicaulis satelles]